MLLKAVLNPVQAEQEAVFGIGLADNSKQKDIKLEALGCKQYKNDLPC